MDKLFLYKAAVWVVALWLAACSPSLNWRQVTVLDSPLRAHFPCRPDHSSRRLALVENQYDVGLTSCRAEEQTFAVLVVNVQQDSRVAQVRTALRQMAEQNFGGNVQVLGGRSAGGSRFQIRAEQLSAQLIRPDRRALQARMLFFSQGSWIFQVTVMGETPQQEAIDFFFDSLLLSADSP